MQLGLRKGERGCPEVPAQTLLLTSPFLLVVALPEPSASHPPCPQGICQREGESGEPEGFHEAAAPAAD